MELRHYFNILRRSWPLVIGLPLLVALLTLGSSMFGPQRYGARVAMTVTQQPVAPNEATLTLPDYNNYHSWATSEFIVDDVPQIVKGQLFARDVAAYIQQQHGRDVPVGAIQNALSADRTHRTVYLNVEAGSQEDATQIAQGAVAMLQTNGLKYWGRAQTAQLDIAVQDAPESAAPLSNTRTLILDVAVRTLLALILAIGIAFLRHYLDQSLHGRDDVEALGLDVVGAIPVVKGAKGKAPAAREPRRVSA
jgi:capsular polysaccharide biosynthesis protein